MSPTRRAETTLLGSVDSCSSSEDLQIPEWHANLWQKRSDQQSRLTQLFHASTNAAQPEPSRRESAWFGFSGSTPQTGDLVFSRSKSRSLEGKLPRGGANEGFRCTLYAYSELGKGVVVMTPPIVVDN